MKILNSDPLSATQLPVKLRFGKLRLSLAGQQMAKALIDTRLRAIVGITLGKRRSVRD